MTLRPYRPSNGTDGSIFEANWCEHCRKVRRFGACRILLRVHAFAIDDPMYPREWVEDDGDGPRCTAFDDAGAPAPHRAGFRCRKTADLFGHGVEL